MSINQLQKKENVVLEEQYEILKLIEKRVSIPDIIKNILLEPVREDVILKSLPQRPNHSEFDMARFFKFKKKEIEFH